MPDTITLTTSRAAVLAAVDSIIDLTIRDDFGSCRDLQNLVAECGDGCEDDMAFLRAARDAGIDVTARAAQAWEQQPAPSAASGHHGAGEERDG